MASELDLDALTAESLGARLRELRTASGVSLRALAARLGISPSAVSQIERGVMRPSVRSNRNSAQSRFAYLVLTSTAGARRFAIDVMIPTARDG